MVKLMGNGRPVTAALGATSWVWGCPSFSNSLGPILVTDLGRDVTPVYEHRVLQFDPTLERKSDPLMPVFSKRESKRLATCPTLSVWPLLCSMAEA